MDPDDRSFKGEGIGDPSSWWMDVKVGGQNGVISYYRTGGSDDTE